MKRQTNDQNKSGENYICSLHKKKNKKIKKKKKPLQSYDHAC